MELWQFGALPVMPIQAMTQQVRNSLVSSWCNAFHFLPNIFPNLCYQATRHARRVYVGGLPATSNEQVLDHAPPIS